MGPPHSLSRSSSARPCSARSADREPRELPWNSAPIWLSVFGSCAEAFTRGDSYEEARLRVLGRLSLARELTPRSLDWMSVAAALVRAAAAFA